MRLVKISFLTDGFNNALTDEIKNRLFIREVTNMAEINTDKLIITSIDQITAYNNANELEFIMDELQDSTISNTQENTDVTGKNGAVIGTLKRNKAVTISGTNGFVVGGVIAAQTGSDVESGSFTVRTMEIASVADNSASITNEPQGAEGAEIIAVYERNTNGSLGKKFEQNATAESTGQFSYADKKLTFFTGDLTNGSEVVVFYDMEVTNASKVSNSADQYSKVLKLYIDVTAQDNCDNVYHGQFVIPRADFTGNFDITMGSDATTQGYEARSLKNTCARGTDAAKLWDFIVW